MMAVSFVSPKSRFRRLCPRTVVVARAVDADYVLPEQIEFGVGVGENVVANSAIHRVFGRRDSGCSITENARVIAVALTLNIAQRNHSRVPGSEAVRPLTACAAYGLNGQAAGPSEDGCGGPAPDEAADHRVVAGKLLALAERQFVGTQVDHHELSVQCSRVSAGVEGTHWRGPFLWTQ